MCGPLRIPTGNFHRDQVVVGGHSRHKTLKPPISFWFAATGWFRGMPPSKSSPNLRKLRSKLVPNLLFSFGLYNFMKVKLNLAKKKLKVFRAGGEGGHFPPDFFFQFLSFLNINLHIFVCTLEYFVLGNVQVYIFLCASAKFLLSLQLPKYFFVGSTRPPSRAPPPASFPSFIRFSFLLLLLAASPSSVRDQH